MKLKQVLLIRAIKETNTRFLHCGQPRARRRNLIKFVGVSPKPAAWIVDDIEDTSIGRAGAGRQVHGRPEGAATLGHLRRWTQTETNRRPNNVTQPARRSERH